MTETITESFCERCGTRYEFEAPRLTTLRKTRGLIGGLRNYLTSQDALSDAMNDARRTEEESLAAVQLDAFHSSFSFCIDCRQYTCSNCWNNTAGRCRSCVPIPGTDDLSERLAASVAADTDPNLADATAATAEPVEAWPTSDLPTEVEAWPGADAFPAEPDPLVAQTPARVVDDVVAEPGTELAALDDNGWIVGEAPPEPEHWPDTPAVEPEPEPVAAEEEEPEPVRPPLRVVAWDEDGTFETTEPEPEPVAAEIEPDREPEATAVDAVPEPAIAEVGPEPMVADVEPEPEPASAEVEPEPIVAEDVEPEPVAIVVEPEPLVAAVESEPEAVVAEVEPEPVVAEEVEEAPEPAAADAEREPVAPTQRIPPIHETILHFPTRAAAPPARVDDDRAAAMAQTPEVAARRAQLDILGLGDPGEGPVAAQKPLPYRSRGAGVSDEELARAAVLRDASFWAASAREVAAATGNVGVQNCGQCGLSLSANARFCRRCGTRQARSA